MKRKNKFWLMLTVCLLGFSQAQAEEWGDLDWQVSGGGTLFLSGDGQMNNPGRVEDVPWYAIRTSIKSVVIEEGVKNIGDYAFSGCLNLMSVTIPQSVDAIGNYAFCDCSGLTSVTIPDKVTSIGIYAFFNCGKLTSVTIPKGIGVKIIGESTFSKCSKLTSITIPDNVTRIGKSAFRDCSSLKYIIIPEKVSTIEDYAFNGSGLESLTNRHKDPQIINSTIFPIGNFTTVYVPSENRDKYDKNDEWKVYTIKVAVEKVTIKEKSVILKRNETKQLTVDILPGTADEKNVTWHSSNTDIVKVSSSGVITAGDTSDVETDIVATTVEGYITSTCRVRIPSSETTLKSLILKGFNADNRLTFTNNLDLNKLNEQIVVDNETVSVTVEAGTTSPHAIVNTIDALKLDVFVPYSINLTVIAEDQTSNNTYTVKVKRDRARGEIDGSNLSWEFQADNDSTLVISGNGTMKDFGVDIPWHAFLTSIKKIAIENSVESIGKYAFYGCNRLTSVTIPEGVTSIGDNAFKNCTGLESVTNLASVPQSINENVFTDNAFVSNLTLYVPRNSISAYRNAKVWKGFKKVLSKTSLDIPLVGTPSAQVYLFGQTLHVDSPVAEQVNIYSLSGTLLYRLEKPAGKTSFAVNSPKQVLIVRGSSGWAGKIRN